MVESGEAPPDDAETEGLPDTATVPAKIANEPYAVASGVRRRGRRRIMKKKTVKDDEGYLGWPYEVSLKVVLCDAFY